MKFSREKEENIIKMYKEGKTQVEIANYYNTYNTSIRRVLKRYNISIRSNSKVQRKCKHNPFKKNDEKSDYFLGLLLTDGCISSNITKSSNSISLALNEKDGYLMKEYRNFISPILGISKIYQKINDSYMYQVSFTNIEVEEWLRRRGNFNNKSYECKIYTPINWNILRGIFDGDGGFHPNSGHLDFFICGKSLVFMNQIIYFLKKEGFNPLLKQRLNSSGNSLYYVFIYKIKEVIRLGELMYNNAHIFLKRKYEKWLSFYESRGYKYTLNSGKETAI